MPACRRCNAPTPTDTDGCPRCHALGALLAQGGAGATPPPTPPPPSGPAASEVAATVAVYQPSGGWAGEILPAGAPPPPARVKVQIPRSRRQSRSSAWAVPVALLLAALSAVAGYWGVPRLLDMAASSGTGKGIAVPGTDLVVDVPGGWEAEAMDKSPAFMAGFTSAAAGLDPKGTIYHRGNDVLFVAGVSLPPGTATPGFSDPQFAQGGQFGGVTVRPVKNPVGPALELSGEMSSGPVSVAVQMTIIRRGNSIVMIGAGAEDSLTGDKLETYETVLKSLREK